ncbi:FkbM family methyltransferase [Micromonospora sp. DT4]|uniref:FkbM family methyltransferase n=1 Tax=Micromonospora sp. DT4 TaxID=3393438 RepID=UPI003CED6788
MHNIDAYRVEGTAFLFEDPDFSVVRDCVPGQAYEPVVATLLSAALHQPNARFADIGALYGFFSCWAARHVPGLSVVAFEPEPAYAEVMRRNIERNRVTVEVAQVALVDRVRSVSFHGRTVEPDTQWATWRRSYLRSLRNVPGRVVERRRGGTRPVVAGDNAPTAGWLAVPLRTRQVERAKTRTTDPVLVTHTVAGIDLDTYAERKGWYPSVAKIDVHGGEGLVLRGMRSVLAKHIDHLFLELHTPDYLVDTTYEEIFDLLEEAGLVLYDLRGFRHRRGALVPITEERRRAICDPRTWTPEELYYMRFLYACRPGCELA